MKKVIIAYIPVLHKGYLQFLEKHDAPVFLLGDEMLAEFPHLRKDVRALVPEQMKKSLEVLGFEVYILTTKNISELASVSLIMSDEDIMRDLAKKYFPQKEILWDSIFLRWDKQNSLRQKEVLPDQHLSEEASHQKMMLLAKELAEKSADWWRQVGAIVTKNGKILLHAKNDHVPDVQQHLYEGDPRGNFHKGEYIELSTAQHAEASVIAEAAKKGISLENSEMYVTTFPCPVCAKLIAYSGIKKLYYVDGYAMIDGESILKANGVEITRVTLSQA